MIRATRAEVRGADKAPDLRYGLLLTEPRTDRLHVGILFQDTDAAQTAYLHLAWHRTLVCDALQPVRLKYAVLVRPDMPPERQAIFDATCRLIVEQDANEDIPYGFGEWRGSFDSTVGDYQPCSARTGLTCATFALAVLELAGYPSLETSAWPARPKDAAWQEEILETMREYGVEQEHIEAVANSIDGVRIRPEEVAAGFELAPPPLTQGLAEKGGTDLRAMLTSQRSG